MLRVVLGAGHTAMRVRSGLALLAPHQLTRRLTSIGGAAVPNAARTGGATPKPTVTPIAASPSATAAPGGATGSTAAAASQAKPKRAWKLKALGVLVAAPLVGVAYARADDDRWEKAERLYLFWTRMMPIYVDYRVTYYMNRGKTPKEMDALFDKLHEKHAQKVLDLTLKLRGMYVKLGQLASTRSDVLPPAYMERLSTLQDGVPQESGAYARALIERELGRPIKELFAEFDDKALGAASIGQAHAAKLHDGTEVVVKIQYPRTKRLFALDMVTGRMFCALAQPEQLPMFDEIERQFMTEFDFRREAWALQTVHDNITPHFGREVVVPRPIPGMVSERVLVMERLHGVKLIDGIKKQWEQIATLQGMSLDDLKKKMANEPIPARPSRLMAMGLDWLKWGMSVRARVHNVVARAYNGTMGRIGLGHLWIVEEVPYINGRKVVDLLMRVHGHEIFIDGVFNGDPHPGNIFLLDDGRLGLIDYGNTKEMKWDDRVHLAELIVALHNRNKEEICEKLIRMEYRTTHMNPYVLEKVAVIYFDTDNPEITEGLNLQLFLEKLEKMDHVEQIGDQYLMAARAGILVRALTMLMGLPNVRGAESWLPYAERVLKENKARRAAATRVGAVITA